MARGGEGLGRRWLQEVKGVLFLAVAVLLFLSFFSYVRGRPQTNLVGPAGHAVASVALQAFGLAAYLLAACLAAGGVARLAGRAPASWPRRGGAVALVCAVALVLGLAWPEADVVLAGGIVGGFVRELLRGWVGPLGTIVVAASALVLCFMAATGASLVSGALEVVAFGARVGRLGAARLRPAGWLQLLGRGRERRGDRDRGGRRRRAVPRIVVSEPELPLEAAAPAPPEQAERVRGRRGAAGGRQTELPFASETKYRRPPISLLDPAVQAVSRLDEDSLIASSRMLEAKLGDFGVTGQVSAVRPGPVITTFEFEPAAGIKVNRIVSLADDLSMALRAMSVRILAPIPGKPVVGIEVSNPRREKVCLREIVQSEAFQRSLSTLTMALGKDPTGNPVVTDLNRMPHLLMAGATGTGKSVCMNALVMSVLFKASPAQVRFIMVDPKMLELSIYESIPHLLVPVVTDPKRAATVLANVIAEMDYRYRLMRDKGVRNLESYNRQLRREADEKRAGVIELTEPMDEEPAEWVLGTEVDDGRPLVHAPMPQIVIIVDELADLMMSVGRDVEESITRLAQKARAAGIHLVLATQRPSVDVITGLIKANFPARMSFQVTSRIDSRTILDAIGAERLLGDGDMLYLPPGTARVQRVHGAFVSEAEIRRVVEFVRRAGAPVFRMELLEAPEEQDALEDEEGCDEMYDEAVRLVSESRQASISWLQRRLRVGYNRAARMIERMEHEGLVGPSDGARPREVLVRKKP